MTVEQFEREVRRLVSLRLERVRYYEIQGGWSRWDEHTDFDSLDHGLDLIGEGTSFCITWDSTFWSYGLRVHSGILLERLLGGQFTDVTRDSRWTVLIGHSIIDAYVHWEITYLLESEQHSKHPQTMILTFESGERVYLDAAMQQSEHEARPLFGMADNVLVIFGNEMADRYDVAKRQIPE